MIIITTRSYLNQLKNIDHVIKNWLAYAEKCRSDALPTSPKLSDMKVQTSHEPDKMATSISKALDYEHGAEEKASELIELRHHIIYQIDGLRNIDNEDANTYYNILMGYYINDLKTQEIADMYNYSQQHIRRLHSKALDAFEQKYGAEYLGIKEERA